MQQLVSLAIKCAAPVVVLAVIGMVVLGLREGDGLATTITSNLMTIAITGLVGISSVLQHFMGAASAGGNATPVPSPTPADSNSTPAGGGA